MAQVDSALGLRFWNDPGMSSACVSTEPSQAPGSVLGAVEAWPTVTTELLDGCGLDSMEALI